MRNRWRVLAFDILAPVAAIAALVYIGIALAWPLWWVSVCSVLCLLIVEGVVVNFVLARRDGVTVGTDDDGPGLRLAVAAVATAALVAASSSATCGGRCPTATLRQRHHRGGRHRQQRLGGFRDVHAAESRPRRSTGPRPMMSPKSAEPFKNEFANVAKDLTSQEHLGSGQHGLGGHRGDRAGRRQRRGDPARDAERTRQADRHRGARTSGPTVQVRRALAGRRRVADPLPLTEHASVVDLQAPIHHHLQSRRFAVTGHLFVPQAEL